MNYGELQARIATTLHRQDLATVIPEFVADAQDAIGRRFGIVLPPLVNDADTDAVLTESPLLYIYFAMHAGCMFLRDADGAAMWLQAFELQAGREVISSGRASTDPYTDADGLPPLIRRVQE